MDRHHAGTKLARAESGDLLLDEVRQQLRIDAYEEMDLRVRTEPPPPY